MEHLSTLRQKWEKLDKSWRFTITAFLGVRLFFAVWSWVILTIEPIAVHYVDVNHQPAVIFLDLYTIQQNTFLRNAGGTELNFRSASRTTVQDLQTGSIWDIHSGTAIKGYFQGIPLKSVPTPSGMFPYLDIKPYQNAWLGMWERFDAIWYLSLSKYGYGTIAGDNAFPPLFPLLIHLTRSLIHVDDFLAGLLISHIATLVVLKLLYTYTLRDKNEHTAKEVVLLLLIFPTSFFFFSVYTASLFLAFTFSALLLMRKGVWHWAAFFIFCATLTHLQGLALIAPMIYLMIKDSVLLRKYRHWVAIVISGLGILFYFYLRSRYISGVFPSVDSSWEPVWHWKFALPWEGYLFSIQTLLSGHFTYIDFLNWFLTTTIILLIIITWKKIPLEYNILTSFSILIMLTRIIATKPLNSMLRYLLTLTPSIYLSAFLQDYPRFRRIIIYTSLALSLYLSAEFFGWGWVA